MAALIEAHGTGLDSLCDASAMRGDRRFQVGRDFVSRLRRGKLPRVHQVAALSELTGVGLYSWLKVFGFDLEDIPRLQAALHEDRTIRLPAVAYDAEEVVEWPADICEEHRPRHSEFVSEVATRFESRPLKTFCGPDDTSIYLKIGQLDTHLQTAFVPGSIVRIDTTDRTRPGTTESSTSPHERPAYAVAHVGGLMCTYVDWLTGDTIALVPRHPRAKPMLCRIGTEAEVLGRVSAELRPMDAVARPVAEPARAHPVTRLVRPDASQQTFGRFLRASREAIGLTHREAHAISMTIARAFGDERFAIGVGTLSDWEAQDEAPYHLAHLVSLAICYAVSFGDLLKAARIVSSDPFLAPTNGTAYDITSLLPVGLRHAARQATGLAEISWQNVFMIDPAAAVLDRALSGARWLIVDRNDRRIVRADRRDAIDAPLFILNGANGRNVCSGCFTHNGHLYLQPDPRLRIPLRAFPRELMLVRGRVVAICRER